MLRLSGVLLALALAALAAPACHHPSPRPPPARVVDLRIVDRSSPEDPLPVDAPTTLAARAAADLRAAGALPVALGEPAHPGSDYQLAIEVGLESGEAGDRALLRAIVAARLSRIGGATGEAPIVFQAVAERSDPKAALRDEARRSQAVQSHLEHALDDVIRGLAGVARLHVGGTASLLAALKGPDPDLRAAAIRLAGARKEKEALPALLALLASEDARTHDLALGALIEIGDRRAVPALTRGVHFQDLAELPKVIDAVAALGGEDAHAFLEFVASSHEQPEMRALAAEAKARLERRASASAATP